MALPLETKEWQKTKPQSDKKGLEKKLQWERQQIFADNLLIIIQ